MTQYHISTEGKPAVCKAQPGNCPLQGRHFRTKDEAEFFLQEHSVISAPLQASIDDVNRVATGDRAQMFLDTELGDHFSSDVDVAEDGSAFTLTVEQPFSYRGNPYAVGEKVIFSRDGYGAANRMVEDALALRYRVLNSLD